MRRFLRETKGAVTVFVTLLLIPAMLVSGTAVDLARLHTARSILQDANQLAANSVLTQYNALLYDMYGLFGFAENDPIFAKLLDEYINMSIFGLETEDRSLGTLQLFYGSGVTMDPPYFPNKKSLDNADVLRRQIEEYMKFRAPVIIVKEFLDAISGNNIREDTQLLQEKLDIEEAIADLYDKYKELYDAIIKADKCTQMIDGIAGGSFGAVSSALVSIRSHFVNLKNAYSAWQNAEVDEEAGIDDRPDYEAHYNAILVNIERLIVGGRIGNTWSNGRWSRYNTPAAQGLNVTIQHAIDAALNFKPNFDDVVRIAREIDEIRDELIRKVDELERKLNDGECSEELRNALNERNGDPPMNLIERYRDILKWENIEGMATVYRNGGHSYIDNEFIVMLNGVKYRNSGNESAGSLTRADMAALSSNSTFSLSDRVSAERSRAAVFAGFPYENVRYHMPPGFLKFAEHPGDNRPFFEALTIMMSRPQLDPVKLFDGQEDESGANAREKQENLIDALLKLVAAAYEGLTNNPLGAKSIDDADTPEPEKLNFLEIAKLIPQAISSPIISIIQDPVGSLASAGDYILLLTYCTSMFSNYTTTRPDSIGKTIDDLDGVAFPNSITGVPISPAVNYFFQSEWEYLYEGSSNAGKNLSAVTRMIFLVRLVCNYISVFSVHEITAIVSGIQGAFAWCPPVGLILGELARAAFVAAESLIDIMILRSGHKLPLIKKAAIGEWICSPSGVVNAIANYAAESAGGEDSPNDEKGLTYSNYMLFFFLTKGVFYIGTEADAASELAKRTANLIEWNIINYQNNIMANEERMTEALAAEDRFRLRNMRTDLSITTNADMRMLFLSMIFAQNFADSRGVSMPPSIRISATDYRGY